MRYLLLFAILLLASCDQQQQADVSMEKGEATEHLKELSWLVGDWRDASDEVDVYITWGWDGEKQFLLQQFRVEGEGEGDKVFEGQQIVGWDPVKQKIRSWIFDSKGGFGEGLWTNEGDTWFAQTIYSMAEGKKATATHVYKKLDNNSYAFSSESREVDGEVLPNMGPFTIVRE